MHNLSKYILSTLLLLLMTAMSSCIKNEFTLTGKFDGAGTLPLHIVYRAANSERAFVVDENVPLMEGSFTMRCPTRYPTIVYLLDPTHRQMYAIYAEKGDKLNITGLWGDPYTWQVSGNEVMEQYCAWAKTHQDILHSTQPEKINAAVAAYIHENPGTRTSLFMLVTMYRRDADEADFRRLLATFKDKDEVEEMLAAAAQEEPEKPATRPVRTLRLTGANDSTMTLTPGAARLTLLYFWREGFGPDHEAVVQLLKDVRGKRDVRTATIFMDTDTIRWRQLLKGPMSSDSITALWATGGEVDPRLDGLEINSTPRLLLLDKNGKTIYNGTDAAAVRKLIN